MARSRINADTPNKIDGVPIGAVTPSSGSFTSLSATGGGTLAGAFTLSGAVALSGSVSGIALTNYLASYLASPADIGGTAPAAGTFTTLAANTATLGGITLNGTFYFVQAAPIAKAAAATLTAAELLNGIIYYTGAAATLTLPTGAALSAALPAGLANDMAFDFSVVDQGTGVVTIAGNTGVTMTTGPFTVTNAGSVAVFRIRKTAASTYVVYRVAG